MDMPYRDDDGVWRLGGPDPQAGPTDADPDGRPPAPRPRLLGWSVVLVIVANFLMLGCATLTGLSTIGLAACLSLAVMSWMLVVAEVLSLRRLYGRDRNRPR